MLLKERHAHDTATRLLGYILEKPADRVASPLVTAPYSWLIPGRTEFGALTESGRPLESGLLKYMISFLLLYFLSV